MENNGLNQYLQPVNSPVVQQQGAVSGYMFDYQNERNAIDLTKIRNFSFSAGTGGTLTLGGQGNGNGILSVLDNTGTEHVRIDNTGITVTNGKISIANNLGTNILDGGGLISTVNFTSSSAQKTSDQAIVGDSFIDVTDLSITTTFSSTRSINVLFLATLTGYHEDFDGILIFRFLLDGNEIGEKFVLATGGPTLAQTVTGQIIYTVPSGSHTIKIQARGNNPSPSEGFLSAAYANSELSYVTLGS